MSSFWSFVFFIVALVLFVRALDFTRRAAAKHRAALVAKGWVENNQPWRLRQDRVARVFVWAFAVVGGILNLWLSHKHMPPGTVFCISLFVGFIVAAIVRLGFYAYVEITHPVGEFALAIRDQQFHLPPGYHEPQGDHGTGKEVAPQNGGFSINPIKWLAGGYQPVVPQGAR